MLTSWLQPFIVQYSSLSQLCNRHGKLKDQNADLKAELCRYPASLLSFPVSLLFSPPSCYVFVLCLPCVSVPGLCVDTGHLYSPQLTAQFNFSQQ